MEKRRTSPGRPWRPGRPGAVPRIQCASAGHRSQNLPTLPGQGVPKQANRVRTRCARPAPRRGTRRRRGAKPPPASRSKGSRYSSRSPLIDVPPEIGQQLDRFAARDLAFWAEVDERDLVQQVIVEPSPPCAAAPLWPRWSGPPPPSRAISPGRRREPTRARSRRECRKRPRREPGHRGRRPALASSD